MKNPLDVAARVSVRSMKVLPTNLVSRSFGAFARTGASKHVIRAYARVFGVAVNEAELPLEEYPTLNAFFTRKLKPGVRPLAEGADVMICPVDGQLSESGACEHDRLLQVKGQSYTLFNLLRDGPMARTFEDGCYVTLYLSPRDYHRVHAPLDLRITGIGYMPGALLPVNGPSVRYNEDLYTHNERLMVYAESDAGPMVMVLVGAHCVGSISLAFHDFVTNKGGQSPTRLNFQRPIFVRKGDEVGMFEMGSTVVMIFEKEGIDLELPTQGDSVRLGQRLGRVTKEETKT